MACKCGSGRIADLGAKCSDNFGVSISSQDHEGYVPTDMGIGGGDYVRLQWCLDCGQIQGKFPLPKTELEHRFECCGGNDDYPQTHCTDCPDR